MPKPPFPSPMPRRRTPADEALERAELALRMQRPAEAEQLVNNILKANRAHPGATVLLAHALLAQNRAAEAVPHLERAARRSGDVTIETLLASALAAAGRSDDALAHLLRITSRPEPFPPAFRELAAQLSRLGRTDEAIAALARGIAAAPQAVDLHVDLGLLHLANHDRGKARECLTVALASAPQRHDIHAALARALLLDGEYAAAADHYRHALALRPDDAMIRADLAAALFELGLRDEGEAALRAATQGRPQMLGRAVHALAASSHGRFFLKPSAVAKFLRVARA